MKEVRGNLWECYAEPAYMICITTNGMVKKNGEAVCGRGCAKEATQYIPGFARLLGDYIKKNGNVPGVLQTTEDEWGAIIFPVKHKWYERASRKLITISVAWLDEEARRNPSTTYVLPRPGCGNGGLNWERDVKLACSGLPDNVYVITF